MTTVTEKSNLSRQVQGALFAAEVNSALTNRARILFFRLRTQAHLALQEDTADLRNVDSLWLDYDELELLVGHQPL